MLVRSIPMVLLAMVSMLLPIRAMADHSQDIHSPNMRLVTTFDQGGDYTSGTDIAFWGKTMVLGNFDSPGGFRLVDISRPDAPAFIGQLECPGSQADVSVWKHLVFVSVDSPRAGPECGAGGGSAWEGVRVVSIADPANPVQLAAVATDCGSHTHTLVPDVDHMVGGRPAPRILLYVLSYPLGATESCSPATHRKFSVVEVPLRDPASASVVSTPDVGQVIGCHDVTVYPAAGLAGAACISESQVWDISDPVNPVILSHITNPALNVHHSTTFSWDAKTLVIGDELGGAAASPGCQSGGVEPSGALWFYDVSNPASPQMRGFFVIPQNEENTLCTAHNFNTVPLRGERDVLVSAWYHGGTTVVDFTDPANPRQLGYYRVKDGAASNAWSSYWYNGYIYVNNFGGGSRGMDVLRFMNPGVRDPIRLPQLNPQTMDHVPPH